MELGILLPILFIFGAAETQAIEDPCPPEDSIYPCYCVGDTLDFYSIYCDKVAPHLIKGILEAGKGRNVSFSFDKVRFGDIPSDLFEGQISTSLHFDHCKIGSFGDRPFSGLEKTLSTLTVAFSIDKRVKDLETFPLSHLKNLRDLSFEGNDIKKLGNDWFTEGPEGLRYASLQANDIEELGDKAFASLMSLEQIWLGDNSVKTVQRSMFPRPANKLTLLEISFNKIETFPEDIFDDMPVLNSIIVSGNPLTTLPETTWGRVWNQLEEIYVERTRLVCDKNIKWIFERKLPKQFFGNCAGYNNMSGKEIKDLNPEELQ